MMDLVHCIYCSAARTEFSAKELTALLEVCRRNNAAIGVTGILLYRAGSFFQVLEGDRPVVDALFLKIAADPRHARTTKIIQESITERSFGAWTMGYPQVSATELSKIPGLNDFFARGASYMDIGEGRAKTLLAAFQSGKWNATLNG